MMTLMPSNHDIVFVIRTRQHIYAMLKKLQRYAARNKGQPMNLSNNQRNSIQRLTVVTENTMSNMCALDLNKRC